MEQKKPNKLSFAERLKQKSKQQQKYGGNSNEKSATIKVDDCPNCGAGRAKHDGVTHCAYCGFEFIQQKISNGIHLKESDNSKTY